MPVLRGAMNAPRNRVLATAIGVIAALATACLLFFTAGVWAMFIIFWGCAHREPGAEPCLAPSIILFAVTASSLLVSWPVYWLVKRCVGQRLDR